MLCLQQRCNQATFNFSEGVINQHLTEAVLSKCRDQSETLSEPVLGLVQGLPLSARLNLIKQHALINPATLNEFVTAKTSYRKTSNSQGLGVNAGDLRRLTQLSRVCHQFAPARVELHQPI